MKRSAEFYRGAVEALDDCLANGFHKQKHDRYRALLAAAQAREAGAVKGKKNADYWRGAVELLRQYKRDSVELTYLINQCLREYEKAKASEDGKLTKAQWIEQYGGQGVLDREGFDVVPCVDCGDSICHGWRVVRREARETQALPLAELQRKHGELACELLSAAEVIAEAEEALGDCASVANRACNDHEYDMPGAHEAKTKAAAALALIARYKEANGGK